MRNISLQLVVLLFFAACSKDKLQNQALVPIEDNKKEIIVAKQMVLVVVDALKASSLSAYEYSRNTSPNMVDLAKEGVLFEQFRSASCWTLPAFTTLTTGMAPSVSYTGNFFENGHKKRESQILRSDIPTLAESLGDDITAGALVTNPYLSSHRGLGRGYAVYDQENADFEGYRNAEEATDTAIDWIKDNQDKPFFYLLHYFDPHVPYRAPERIKKMFWENSSGRLDVKSQEQFRQVRTGKMKLTKEEIGHLRDLYDAEVRFVDEQLGRLVNAMKKMGLLDTSYIVVTADHGEEHFEHGGFEHGHRYEDETVRVPLIIRAPGGRWNANKRVPWSAGLIDLFPTILEWFGKPIPDHAQGKSLNPLITGKENAHREYFMEHKLYGAWQFAWFDGRYKLITDKDSKNLWVYDLKNDPNEKKKLTDHPKVAELKERLFNHRKQLEEKHVLNKNKDETVPVIPKEVEDALRSLGYIE